MSLDVGAHPVGDGLQGDAVERGCLVMRLSDVVEGVCHAHRPRGGLLQKIMPGLLLDPVL